MILAHQSSITKTELDLLLILKEYRKQGIGRALVYHAVNSFPTIATCETYLLQFANNATFIFYQTIGFINQGIPIVDKINLWGIHYKDMYYHFTYDVKNNNPKN